MQTVRLHLAPATTSAGAPTAPLEPPSPAPAIVHACPAASTRTHAAREFVAQVTGSLAASGLRHALRAGGHAGAVAGAVLVGTGLAGAAWRALSLGERALQGEEGRAHWACRLALAALPVMAAAAATMAVGSAQAPAAVALFAGGLVERAVRDLTSHGLAPWLARVEAVHPDGGGITPALLTHIEWARALEAMPRTMACTTIQCGAVLAAGPAVAGHLVGRVLLDAGSSGLLEAARAVINHRATERQAGLHGLVLRPAPGRGARAALERAADICSLRETLAVPGELVTLFAGAPATAGMKAALALGLGTLKGLGEVRTALVNLGRAAPLSPVPPPA